MLLTTLALIIGYGIGRARGGSWSSVLSARIDGKGFLIAGVSATLILNLFTPSFPLFWLTIGFIGFIGFTVSNLAKTGAIVLMLGLLLNLAPVLANGAVPVSEVALQSVDVVDSAGTAKIDGPRESTATATRLSFLGDVIPVPVADKVVSVGDLIALVAVADILVNLMLRSRRREFDDAGVSFSTGSEDRVETAVELEHDHDPDRDDAVIDLREPGSGPAHAAPGGVRLTPPLPRVRRPAHAIRGSESEPERHIPPPSPTTPALFAPVLPESPDDAVIDLTDQRPIIDLTMSPSDEQLTEFLRRRAEADRRLTDASAAPPPPRSIRGTRRRRRDRANSKSEA